MNEEPRLYPRCARLADMPPYARGLDLRVWRMLDIHGQCEDWLYSL